MKRFIIAFMLVNLLVFSVSVSYGVEKELPEGVPASLEGFASSNDLAFGSNKIDIHLNSSNQYISFANASLQDMGNQIIEVSTNTRAISAVNKLSVIIYLEKWTGSNWSIVTSWNDSINNSNVHNFSTLYRATSGDYYRISAIHTVSYNGITENVTTLTSYLIVK